MNLDERKAAPNTTLKSSRCLQRRQATDTTDKILGTFLCLSSVTRGLQRVRMSGTFGVLKMDRFRSKFLKIVLQVYRSFSNFWSPNIIMKKALASYAQTLTTISTTVARSLMYIRNKPDPKIPPCDTPVITVVHALLPKITLSCLAD